MPGAMAEKTLKKTRDCVSVFVAAFLSVYFIHLLLLTDVLVASCTAAALLEKLLWLGEGLDLDNCSKP